MVHALLLMFCLLGDGGTLSLALSLGTSHVVCMCVIIRSDVTCVEFHGLFGGKFY